MSQGREAKVYVNGSLVGTHPDPDGLAEQIRSARRRGAGLTSDNYTGSIISKPFDPARIFHHL